MRALTSFNIMPDEPNWRNFDQYSSQGQRKNSFSPPPPNPRLTDQETSPLLVPLGPLNPHRGPRGLEWLLGL